MGNDGFHDSEKRYPNGQYDRIICDVPCTGDGAIRKSPGTWFSFHPENGIRFDSLHLCLSHRLHSIQLQIALRAAALLKEGGVMTYSTCSMNPIENEAVVAELLERWHGK